MRLEQRALVEVTAGVSRCVGGAWGAYAKSRKDLRDWFFFFWSRSHPYNKRFLSLYAFPHTIFLAGGKGDESHTPAFREFAYLRGDRH